MYRDVLGRDMMECRVDLFIDSTGANKCAQCPGGNDYGQGSLPSGLSDVVQVAADLYHTCALKRTGTVVCWGAFLLGFAYDALLILAVGWPELARKCGFASVLSGSTACNGLSKPAGANIWVVIAGCQLPGDYQKYVVQCRVPQTLSGIVQITAGTFHNCALKADGTCTCWGTFKLACACAAARHWLICMCMSCWHGKLRGPASGASIH